jgi:hypothetical protein
MIAAPSRSIKPKRIKAHLDWVGTSEAIAEPQNQFEQLRAAVREAGHSHLTKLVKLSFCTLKENFNG